MGMPEDFILYGNANCLAKIGQNVPVGTAKFIVNQMANVINNWNTVERNEGINVLFQDNISQKMRRI